MWAWERSTRSRCGKVAGPKRGLDQATGPQLGRSLPDADAALQSGVGQHPGAVEVEEHGGVTQPGDGEPVIGPGRGIGTVGCRSDIGLGSHESRVTSQESGAGVMESKSTLEPNHSATVTRDSRHCEYHLNHESCAPTGVQCLGHDRWPGCRRHRAGASACWSASPTATPRRR